MAKAPLYDASGRRAGETDLSEAVFGSDVNIPLVHQKVVAERNAARQGTHDTRGRSEVAGGGRKPYRQKGTGRARQGSTRAPHYRHGGIVFGPTPRDYTQDMPRRMKQAALRSALSAKAADGQLLVIEDFKLSRISTREAALLLDAMEIGAKALLVVEDYDGTLLKSVRNIPGVVLRTAREVSTMDVVNGGQVVLTRAALVRIEEASAK
ncbi:MAG: 50S ribosomal protein L4 [Armatimonadetes bacterium]|nr:50S ribosomal protein L4 [Armatimonadota bacterium]